jgi:F0F1-type ATP synthase membrane subunit b/b'
LRRWIVFAAIFCWAACAAVAQDPVPHSAPAEAAHEGQAGEHDESIWTLWKVANFAILAAGLGYLFIKKGKPFFEQRTAEIRKGIESAAAEKRSAEARFAEIERRLSNLDAEIVALRALAKEEMEAEYGRIRLETEQRLAKIRHHTEQEILSIAKMARESLKSYSAALAIDLAGRRIRNRITPEVQQDLVSGFAAALSDGGGRN